MPFFKLQCMQNVATHHLQILTFFQNPVKNLAASMYLTSSSSLTFLFIQQMNWVAWELAKSKPLQPVKIPFQFLHSGFLHLLVLFWFSNGDLISLWGHPNTTEARTNKFNIKAPYFKIWDTKLPKLKVLCGSSASSDLLQNRLNWILEQHVFPFSTGLGNTSQNIACNTYAGVQLRRRYSWFTKEAIWPFQFYTGFPEDPNLLLQDQ